jgi:hypothetical protein
MHRSARSSLVPWLLGCATMLLAACGGGSADPSAALAPPPGTAPVSGAEKLVSADADTLAGHFVARLAAAGTPEAGDVVAWGFASPRAPSSALGMPVTASALSANAAGRPTVTNAIVLQEAGVDEDDVVRSDKGIVYALTPPHSGDAASQSLVVRRAVQGGAAAPPLAVLTLDAAVRYSGLFLDPPRRQLLAIGDGSNASPVPSAAPGGGMPTILIADARPFEAVSTVSFFDLPETDRPARRTTLAFDGAIQAARVADGRLWLVLRHRPGFEGFVWGGGPEASVSNRGWLERFSLAQVLPGWRVDGRDRGRVVAGGDCYLQPATPGGIAVVTSIVSVDLATPAKAPLSRCIAAPVDTVYMAPGALFLATTRYPTRAVTTQSANGVAAAISFVPTTPSTDFHKFSLGADRIDYRGSGTAPGRLSWGADTARFMLSATAEDLRVVTQLDPGAAEGPARLSILRDEGMGVLRTVSSLPNERRTAPIGKAGEQVHAVRFVEDRAYVVTFRRTDPVYAIDLSDPTDPRLLGALEVPGFSDRLYPLGTDLLLGVGHDAQSWNDTDYTTGVLVSLLDVRDPTRPREIARRVIGERGSMSASDFSPHGTAFERDGGRVRIALPVSVHAGAPLELWPGAPAAIGGRPFSRLAVHRFEVDLDAPALVEREALVAPDAGGTLGHDWGRDAGRQAFDRGIHVGGETWLWYDGRLVGAAW